MSLVAASELEPASVTLLDVRWALTTGADRDAYLAGHLPGAAFVDLDRDLAAPPGPAGRHPLPPAERFVAAMRAAGVRNDQPVVVYDDQGALAAARAWWLLRYYGHRHVRVLDGGLAAWQRSGKPLETGTSDVAAGDFDGAPGAMPVLDADAAAALPMNGVLVDVRAPGRFRGELEPVDPVAGHIPGAVNRPVGDSLAEDGTFRVDLADRFADLRAGEVEVGVYCGSGVSAAHTVLALELAGVRAALFPGSWSGWITDPGRPVATGPEDGDQAGD